jgi:hypothetical protein
VKVKMTKSLGGIDSGEVREVGWKTAQELIKYGYAEEVRKPGRPPKKESTDAHSVPNQSRKSEG